MRDGTIPHGLASRRGFASGPGGLLTVGFLAIVVVAALAFALDRRPGDLAVFENATPQRRVLPACPTVAELPADAVGEGGMGLFFRRRIERSDDGALVLTRTRDGRRLRLAAGVVGVALVLWITVLVVARKVDSTGLDEALDRRPALKIAVLVGAGLPMAAIGLVLLAGMLVLLPVLPFTIASGTHVVRVEAERVALTARDLPMPARESVVPTERVVGVDASLGVRIGYRDEAGRLRVIRVPIADDAWAAIVACAVIRVLRPSPEG